MARSWALIERARWLLAGEQGAIVKDWGGRLPIALIFPNAYFVGMSSLGLQTVYGLLNSFSDVVCERAFLNLGKSSSDVETLSIESQRPLKDFPVIGFSLSYELDYPNVIRILRDAGIPPLASERQRSPLVIAGGPAISANPLPLAPILDVVLIGELEDVAQDLATALWALASKQADLDYLTDVPGLYVPGYHTDMGSVRRVWTKHLDDWETATVVATGYTEFPNMHLVEVARGCGRSCRFCLAGHIYRPVRERSTDSVLSMAGKGLAQGRTIGLLAPSLSDSRGLRPVLKYLVGAGARVSLSSLRADSLDEDLMADMVAAGNDTLTIAPEAGCARLRHLIGKEMDIAAILGAAALAEACGFRELKLYFMIGLPTETEDDIREAVSLVRQVRAAFSRRLVVNVSCFVPKPNTPFQWLGMTSVPKLESRLAAFTRALRGTGVTIRSESPQWSLLQAALARGDERIGLALAAVGDFSRQALLKAFAGAGIEIESLVGPRAVGEPLPWDVVESGLPPGYLQRQAAALEGSNGA
ncbi:MAG: radical SAM protein [Anaerolineae bacterium]